MNDAGGERPCGSNGERGKKKGKEGRQAWEEGICAPKLMNILMVVCSGIRNLKV
jgi:hypothetical protein